MTMHNTLMQRELDKLKERFLLFGARVEAVLARAIKAAAERDAVAAARVIEEDRELDQLEVDLEEECLKLLALHQPVAGDLRFIVAVLKINNDLERVGDQAVNIAEHVLYLSGRPLLGFPFDFTTMAAKAEAMLRQSLDALVNLSSAAAQAVRDADDEIDEMHERMYGKVEAQMREDPDNLDCYIHVIGLSRCLERVADLATNVAEDVIYLVEGEIVRHDKYN
jgi:phosphate transport system protein